MTPEGDRPHIKDALRGILARGRLGAGFHPRSFLVVVHGRREVVEVQVVPGLHGGAVLEAGPMAAHSPIGIYAIPEISMVGATEHELTEAKVPYETGVARYREIARG